MSLLPSFAGAKSKDLPREVADIAFNKAGFVGTLPMKTIICPQLQRAGQTPAALDMKTVEQDMHSLGKLRGREFALLSPNSKAPLVQKAEELVLPEEMRSRGIRGEFRFWVLVSTTGEVDSLYCLSAPDRDAAGPAAECVGKWRFTPAERLGEKLPVLVQVAVAPKTAGQ